MCRNLLENVFICLYKLYLKVLDISAHTAVNDQIQSTTHDTINSLRENQRVSKGAIHKRNKRKAKDSFYKKCKMHFLTTV